MHFLRVHLAALFILATSSPTMAAEASGDSLVSEQPAHIEITVPNEQWEIRSAEDRAYQIAEMTSRPVEGLTATVTFWGVANPGAKVSPDQMIENLRKAFSDQGMEVGEHEPRKYGGKRVLTFQAQWTTDRGSTRGVVYLMTAKDSLFWAQFFATDAAYDRFRPTVDEIVAKTRY